MLKDLKNTLSPTAQKEDPFVNILGHFGRWQLMVFTTVSMIKLCFGWVQLAILFLTPNVTFQCVNLPNCDKELDKNTCYKGCIKYKYDTTPYENTIVSEWDLICERRWLASFTQTMLQFGILVGSILTGYLSDRYGRKYTFIGSVYVVVVLGMLVPFSTSYFMFTALRTLQGVAVAGSAVIAFVIVMESIGSKYREVIGCLFHLPQIVGHITLSPIAYFYRSWDKYMLAMGVPSLLYLGYFFTVPESPRWLISQGKVDRAIKVVTKAAKMNKRSIDGIESTLKQAAQDTPKNANEPKVNYSVLFRRVMLVKTLCTSAMWLITGMIYYGFNQYLSQTSRDPFISVALAGLIQIPSNILSIWFIKKFGRRPTISGFFILCGLCVIIMYLVPDIFAFTLAFGTLGVSCAAIVATSIYIYTTELYPTVVRNMGLGACSTAMRIGAMIAPFVSNIVDILPWLPTAIFAATAFFAGLICLILPETKGVTLPDNIEDLRNRK